jgi:hypothetical protein
MDEMKKEIIRIMILIPALATVLSLGIAGCGQKAGPDSISSRGEREGGNIAFLDCTRCHTDPWGNRRAVIGVQGDFGMNPAISSHHVAGSTDPANTQCTICHDISQHMGGVVRLIVADTSAVIPYDPANPAGIEPFCLSCHDSNGAAGNMAPFGDGQTIGAVPYRMSAEIKTHWNKAYGHQQQGLTCLGNGTPGTGCHANGHGSAFVGILAKNLTLPYLVSDVYDITQEGNYELCFNCHANYPRVTKEVILGVMQFGNYDVDHGGAGNPPYYIPAIQTLFRDRYDDAGQSYDDAMGFRLPGTYWNLHFLHLQLAWGWNYRDIPGSSYVHCLSCHNVHGSDTQWGWLYDEMGFNHFAGAGSDEYGAINDIAAMSDFPIGCTNNCHTIAVTEMWFEPPNE